MSTVANEAAAVAPEERSYWQIVDRQFRRNRRAVWGLRVVIALILVAVFAPLIANDKPLVFCGYRHRLYVETYDQFVYAHADLLGLGRGGQPLVIPGLYEDGIYLPGIADAYQRDRERWEAGNPTWRMIQNVAFGPAEAPMNAMRAALTDTIKVLDRDARWARGARDVAWLKTNELPADLEAQLDELVVLCRANLADDYRAKVRLRQDALRQQLWILGREVSGADNAAIEVFLDRYEAELDSDLYLRDPAELAAYDVLILEVRERLRPDRVIFALHTDFPALRQLIPLDIFFMLSVLLWVTRGVWGLPLGWWWLAKVPRVKRQIVASLGAAALAAVGWWVLVPAFNDTTNYERGMHDGSLACAWRVMPPLRYGVNQNDPQAKYAPPWWQAPLVRWVRGQLGRPQAGSSAPGGAPSTDAPLPGTAHPPAEAPPGSLERLARSMEEVDRAAAVPTTWEWLLDVLARHHMGTDGTGRDLATRMVWGSRISLSIGFVAVGIYALIGIFFGALAGYFGGVVDMVISRLIEIMICFPTFFLILTVVAFLDPSVLNIMLVIGVVGWTGVARLVRGEFLRLRQMDFVTAGHALGFSNLRIIFRHILPSALAPVLVAATFGVASAILVESGLSFLGFGVKVPTPTWGSVLSSARESWIYWWLTMFPGFAIFLTITMYNLVGEGVRDAVDPKLRQ